MRIFAHLTAALAATFLAAGNAAADTPPPQNVVQLSATGTVEVVQDMLTLVLSATREAQDAAAAQAQLKGVLDSALAAARPAVVPGQVDVRTGNFTVQPRYSAGHIVGWVGIAELLVEGRDIARVSQLAGRIQGMTVASAGFGLSREQRTHTEADAQSIAIERFRAKAAEIARGFGFAGYSLREVAVSASEPPGVPRPRPLVMSARAAEAAEAPVPAEAGRAAVTVTVSGSVQLR